MAWRTAPHTADLVIEAEATDAGAALAEAAVALSSVLTGMDDPRRLPSHEERSFRLEAPDAPSLVVAFLSELVWLNESEDLLWTGGGVDLGVDDGGMHWLEAVANHTRHDARRHGRGVEVKAVTYHELVFEAAATGWRLRVLLDV